MSKQQRTIRGLATVCTLALILTPRPGAAQCELTKLNASDEARYSEFGGAVAMSRDLLVVGAASTYSGAPHEGAGTAYIFRREGMGWIEEGQLPWLDEWPASLFGTSVAMHDNSIIVGAPNAPVDPPSAQVGEAYIFTRIHGVWHQEARLFPPDTDSDSEHNFGYRVALSDEFAVAGSTLNYGAGIYRSGSVYVFKREDARWTFDAKLVASDAGAGDRFGRVAIAGDYLLVGAPGHDGVAENAGAVYVFRRVDGTWVEDAKLTASDAGFNDAFGDELAADGSVAAVRAPGEGTVYVFRRQGSSWVQEEIPYAGGSGTSAVAIKGNVVVIGDPNGMGAFDDTGVARVYRYAGGNWSHETTLAASDGTDGDQFGFGVATDGTFAAVGAPGDSDIAHRGGAAYVYGIVGDCNENGIVDVCEIADVTASDCSDNTIPDECEPDCNSTGEADSCDIVAGTSVDCDGDEIPYECETEHDADGDGVEDCSDGCPNDPSKTEPGQCDCGLPDDDLDGDGTANCLDQCVEDANKTQPGICGCGILDEDSDADGIIDCAAQISLVPVGASGLHMIDGNEIIIPGGAVTVTLEIRIANWDPHELRIWQVMFDLSGFTSGDAGTAYPLGWDRPMQPSPCSSDANCPPEWPFCFPLWDRCVGPDHDPEIGAFIDESRSDFVFYGLPTINAVDLLSYRFGCTSLDPNQYPIYAPPPKYAGTLILNVSSDADGTFVMGFEDNYDETFLRDPFFKFIVPLVLVPARITIQPPTCGNGECELGEDEASCPGDCAGTPVEGVPTLSTWGVVVLMTLLLVVGKIYFGRRRTPDRMVV